MGVAGEVRGCRKHFELVLQTCIFLTTPIRRLRRHIPRKGEGSRTSQIQHQPFRILKAFLDPHQESDRLFTVHNPVIV